MTMHAVLDLLHGKFASIARSALVTKHYLYTQKTEAPKCNQIMDWCNQIAVKYYRSPFRNTDMSHDEKQNNFMHRMSLKI